VATIPPDMPDLAADIIDRMMAGELDFDQMKDV
jgi:hypothetical protein